MFNTTQTTQTHFTSIKEKTNILTLVSIVLTYGFYFFRVLQSGITSPHLGTLLSVTIIFIILMIFVRSIMPFGFKDEAPLCSSQKEKEAMLEANQIAYYVLFAGIATTLILTALSATSAWIIPNMVLFFVLSELTKYTAELVCLRRSRLSLP